MVTVHVEAVIGDVVPALAGGVVVGLYDSLPLVVVVEFQLNEEPWWNIAEPVHEAAVRFLGPGESVSTEELARTV